MAESSSSKMSKSRSKLRRASIVTSASQSLRETLSAFGDDVIKVKDPRRLSHLPLSPLGDQSSTGGGGGSAHDNGINPSGISFPSLEGQGQDYDFDLMSSLSSQQQMKFETFERIPSSEVGVRSSRWKKAIIAKLFSSKLSSKKGQSVEGSMAGNGGNSNGDLTEGHEGPPFWGVGSDQRAKVSTLTLQLVLHEIACFTSCILLGCLVVQALEGISWIKNPEIKNNWLFSRLYGSFLTLLLVFTSIGFLLRIDTTDKSSLLTMPLLLIPTVLLSISEYLNKSWGLQREECLNYLKMDEISKHQVHLTQNCESYLPSATATIVKTPDIMLVIMRICPAILCFGISLYMFICRTSFYMISRFKNCN